MTDFLQPISEDQPCGEYLRYDPVYDELRELRRVEESESGIWDPLEPRSADWAQVKSVCEDVLTKRSKDLQIAFWRTEALIYLESLAGASKGLDSIVELMETFWESLYPEIDKEEDPPDLDFRLAPLRQAARDLPVLFTRIAISAPAGGAPALSLGGYVSAQRNDGSGELNPEVARQSFAATNPEWLKGLIEAADATKASLKRVEDVCEQHCGYDAPSFSETKGILSNIQEAIKANVSLGGEDGGEVAAGSAPGVMAGGGGTTLQVDASRNGCYQMLERALRSFETGEPHSPVVPILRHLVFWKDRGLHEIAEKLEGRGSSLADVMKAFPASTRDPEED